VSAVGGASAAARPEPVARLTGLSLGRLAWLQATHRRASAAGLGLCLAIAVVMPALLPLLDGYALERAVAETAASNGAFTVQQKVADVDQFGSFQHEVAARVEGRAAGSLLPVTAFASTAALYPTTRNTDPVPADLAGRAFQLSYLDGLPDHVEMQAGQIPPDGLGGGDPAVTIPQAGADLAGLNLFDRICLSFSSGEQRQSSWCARIVGLWRPLDARDPFWGGRPPVLELAMGRYDFFQLAGRQPPQGAVAGLRYWVDPAAVDGARATQLADTVSALAAELRTPQRQVLTSLDASLTRVSDQHRTVSAILHLFTAALALLGLVVAGLVGVGFVREQSHLLAVLKARGWPPARICLQAFVGLAAPAVYGIPIALAACILVLALVGPAGSPAGAAALRSAQGRTALYVAGVLAGFLVVMLATIAASAVWRDLRPSLEGPFRPPRTERSRPPVTGLLAALGLAGLLSVRLPSPPSGPASDALGLALGVLPMAGVLCLALATSLMPLGAGVGRGGSVPTLLARWQLRRAPTQHAAPAGALALAAAASALAVLTLVWGRPDGQLALQPALRAGLEATLALGSLAILALLLIGTALHDASVRRRRLDEYSGLVGHGLSGPQIRGSLGREQAVTAAGGLLVGTLLGVFLATLLLADSPPTSGTITAALAGLAAVTAALLAGTLAVGALARRLPDRLEPLRGLEH
jgi:hypothetical protein